MTDKKFCTDYDGNKVYEGDTVLYYPLSNCRGEPKKGVVKAIGDMNEQQTNMPYIKGAGAWSKSSIRKVQ